MFTVSHLQTNITKTNSVHVFVLLSNVVHFLFAFFLFQGDRLDIFEKDIVEFENKTKLLEDENIQLKSDAAELSNTTTVDAFSHGPILGVLYKMSCEVRH